MALNGYLAYLAGVPALSRLPGDHETWTRFICRRPAGCRRGCHVTEPWRSPGGALEEPWRSPPLAFANEIWYRDMCHIFHFPTGVQPHSATLKPLVHRCTASSPLWPGGTRAGDLWGCPELAAGTSTAHPLNLVAWRRGGPWLHPVPWMLCWTGIWGAKSRSVRRSWMAFMNGEAASEHSVSVFNWAVI